MQADRYSDADLVAYLDGRLDDEERSRLKAAAAEDPHLAERLDALATDTGALRDGFDDLLGQAPDLSVPQALARRATYPGWTPFAAAAVFVIGLGIGWMMGTEQEPDGWHQAVADYQVLYTTETLAASPLGSDARAAGLANASRRVGLELTEDLLAVEGMVFQRAQVLSYEGSPLIQVAYLTDDGMPVAFCIMRQGGSQGSLPEGRTLAGLAASTWQAGEHAFILIGPVGAEVLANHAKVLSERLPG